jgi:ketol-acid reductoisomerase
MSTNYLVQGFTLRGTKLVADVVRPCKTEALAISTAERLGPIRAGVVAFSQEVDVETDAYDTPVVLLELGRLPPGLFD